MNDFWNQGPNGLPSLRSIFAEFDSDAPRKQHEEVRAIREAGYHVVEIGNPLCPSYIRADDFDWLTDRGFMDFSYREHYYVFADEKIAFEFRMRWG